MVLKNRDRMISKASFMKAIYPDPGKMIRHMVFIVMAVYHIACNSHNELATASKPVPDRFTEIPLITGLDEPLQIVILYNNDILFVERKGSLKMYRAADKKVFTIANFLVFSGIEDGLLGVAADPHYAKNHWIYLYYSLSGNRWVNRLSRFELKDDRLLKDSEKVLLEIPTQRIYCCHSAGCIAFDSKGLLYLSTGDNTAASAASREGYPPMDERKDHELADAQGTAANSKDLRGKILRIRPTPEGGYEIPEGNLFAADSAKGRPEIYVMGCRNPYRISIDPGNEYLYWGEIGPNTIVRGRDSTIANYDEINQARSAGFFGWPYFIGNNDAYPHYDFATKVVGPKFDPLHPVNTSHNNTGIRDLPPAQPAFIWYGIDSCREFPLLGKGTASAMAGPVYRSELFKDAKYKLPIYYDGKLFIYDWMRRWIMAVTMDEKGNYKSMEPFLEQFHFTAPIDMKIGPDGAIYILEYGTNWFAKNTDARLVRIEYASGNRNPEPVIHVDRTNGAAPLTVRFSSAGSADRDRGDSITASEWKIGSEILKGCEIEHRFTAPGVYNVQLTVKDSRGGEASRTIEVSVGNSAPQVMIHTDDNHSFYWEGSHITYVVEITDAEDSIIAPERIQLSFQYLPQLGDSALSSADDAGKDPQLLEAKQQMSILDCKSCHSMKEASAGPSFISIAERYRHKENVAAQLALKIIKGGGGVWGDRSMSPHPDLKPENAKAIVSYILSLSDSLKNRLPLKGTLHLKGRPGSGGACLLSVAYTDNGAHGAGALTGHDRIILRDPILKMEGFDEGTAGIISLTNVTFLNYITRLYDNGFVKFRQLDLTGVKKLIYRAQPDGDGGVVELHIDRPDGRLVSTAAIPPGKVRDRAKDWIEITTELHPVSGKHDLYFVFRNPHVNKQNLFNLDWVYFLNK
jgi:cytochrome c